MPIFGSARRGAGAATAAALGLLGAALVRYTSDDRRVLARWSFIHFTLIVLVLVVLGWVLYRVVVGRMAYAPGGGWAGRAGSLGLLTWSTGFLIDSLEDPSAGGRLLDLRIFSSTIPVSIVLEWLSMTLLVTAALLLAARRVRPPRTQDTRRDRTARNLLALGASCAVMLLIAEGVVRLRSLVWPEPQGFPSRAQAVWTRRFVRVNSLGYRDVEHAREPAAGVTRIALIGDSSAYGLGIDDPKRRVGDLLEQALNRTAGGRRFEVVQAARPNTHTLHHIEVLRRLLEFRPQYVVLIYVFNDIEHALPPGAETHGLRARVDPLRILLVNSVTAEQVFLRVRRAWYARAWHTLDDPYRHDGVLAEHLRALTRFVHLAREAGAEARLVPLDPTVQLAARSERYRRFERAAATAEIPVWSLQTAFAGHEWRTLVVNSLDNHPNELAHALTAQTIVERFQSDFGLAAGAKR